MAKKQNSKEPDKVVSMIRIFESGKVEMVDGEDLEKLIKKIDGALVYAHILSLDAQLVGWREIKGVPIEQ